ncbi:MAG TPA: DUF4230 domain-containing protein, partial [Anaerovoracaceae bacterium]|nr:DUF4230 domain-containing protein [Anaerovoracaceae bacterium]
VIYLIIVAIIAAVIVFVVLASKWEDQPEITNTYISNKLEAASELTSAKMTYNGLVRYSDGEIAFLTKKEFTMIYRADVRVGIDLSKVKTNVTNSKVEIAVPPIEVLDVSVDTDSIEYYDEKYALFNWESKDDALEAIEAAKKDVTAKGDMEGLMTTAKDQIDMLLKGMFQDSIGDRRLVINYEEAVAEE